MLSRVVVPAAAVLTHGPQWADAVLTGQGQLPVPPIAFDYFDPELVVTAASISAGLALPVRPGRRHLREGPGFDKSGCT
jgi:hypothetical protein